MQELIVNELKRLEKQHSIRILYAVESGSRAWGFASKDSDWDVRFLYVHPPEWYLSIDEKKDSMEIMLPNELDFAGWELRKTLKLFRKSNPPLLEWLRSPLIYLEQYSTAKQMRQLSDEYFSPKSCLYHYLHMASRNYKAYLHAEKVKIKKYFYVLRPLLACKWIEENDSIAPMEFDKLVSTQVNNVALKGAIEVLMERKKLGEELDLEPRIPIIHNFIDTEIQRFTELIAEYDIDLKPNTNKLNALFRITLQEIWE